MDFSSFMPDLQSCRSFCDGKSRFFTYDLNEAECFCKSSNVEPFVEESSVSGETGCLPGKRHKEMSSASCES